MEKTLKLNVFSRYAVCLEKTFFDALLVAGISPEVVFQKLLKDAFPNGYRLVSMRWRDSDQNLVLSFEATEPYVLTTEDED